MYTMILILAATFGNQTIVNTLSIDGFKTYNECVTVMKSYIADPYYDGLTVEAASCTIKTEGTF